jgi:hypothetical protein
MRQRAGSIPGSEQIFPFGPSPRMALFQRRTARQRQTSSVVRSAVDEPDAHFRELLDDVLDLLL